MKKILLSVAAVSTLAIAAPAAAQYSNGGYQNQNGYGQNGAYGNAGVAAQLGRLQARVDAGARAGAISRQDAVQLGEQLRQLSVLERQYARGGISARERADLQVRMRDLRQRVRFAEGRGGGRSGQDGRYGNVYDRDGDGQDDRYERDGRYGNVYDRDRDGRDDRYERDGRYGNVYDRDGDGRDDRYERDGRYGNVYDRDGDGRDDRYERDGRYGNVYDRDGDGRDDRYERDGRYGNVYDRDGDGRDDRYQRGGRYESRNSRGGILGGVLGGVLGGGGHSGGVLGTVLGSVLRVGQRATGNLYAVPSDYQHQFRDGNGVYYRSDGQAIYQIDARTQTVLQVHPLRR
ncbi:MAG: hypothetical protein M3Q08_07960 [Pseudomonadota bacterium]|nr:hypothetical protein [Pseudomonadota bacterium]